MGNGQTKRRVQSLVPFLSQYDRLSGSSLSPERQSLLPNKDYDVDYWVEQIKPTLEAICKKNAALEKDVHELRTKIATPESKSSKDSEAVIKRLKGDMEKLRSKNTTLEKEVDELKKKVVKLELLSPIDPIMKKQESAIEAMKKMNSEVENRMNNLTTQVNLMESTFFINNNMTLQPDSSLGVQAPAAESPEISNDLGMNDLMGCLVVLIFLISILIGINM